MQHCVYQRCHWCPNLEYKQAFGVHLNRLSVFNTVFRLPQKTVRTAPVSTPPSLVLLLCEVLFLEPSASTREEPWWPRRIHRRCWS